MILAVKHEPIPKMSKAGIKGRCSHLAD